MIAHVILFTPKPELTDAARRDLLDSLVAASADAVDKDYSGSAGESHTVFPGTSS